LINPLIAIPTLWIAVRHLPESSAPASAIRQQSHPASRAGSGDQPVYQAAQPLEHGARIEAACAAGSRFPADGAPQSTTLEWRSAD